MSTYTHVRQIETVHHNGDEVAARVFLQPIAPPSILGLYGFAAATFIVAAHLAGWYGSTSSNMYLWPFAAVFGGVAQSASVSVLAASR